MRQTVWKRTKSIFAVVLAMAVCVTFIPINFGTIHAASFSTNGSVTGLKMIDNSATTITLQWDAYTGAQGYKVYKSKSADSGFTRIKTLSETKFKRTNLTTNLTCYYKVRAYVKDSKGNYKYSKYSAVVAATPQKFSTSGSVAGLVISSNENNTVTLSWDSYVKAQGYEIYKATKNDGTYESLKSLQETTYTRTGLTAGKTCYYKVRAYAKDSKGKVSYSKFSSIVAGTPKGFIKTGAPQEFKLSDKTYNSVSFTWTAYDQATGYQIYKATSKNGTYSKIKSTTSTSYKRTGLSTNKTCYYKLRAYRKSGSSTEYSKFSPVISGTPQLSKPNVTVASSSSGITVSWEAVAGATGYKVYRATSKSGDYSRVKTLSGKSFSNTSISSDKNYYYKVRAYRTINGTDQHGSYSSPLAGMKTSVARVKGLTASSESDCVRLKWSKTTGATGYQIKRASGTDGTYTTVGEATTNSFKDVNVANGVTYYYKVRAFKKVGDSKIYGNYNAKGYSRSAVVSTAVAWLGCKESNKSNKPIVDLYNKNMGTNFSYTTAWCAMFVSAVAIKSGTTSIIVRGSYCPTVINTYKKSKVSNYSYGSGSKYVPKAGDVIFFDWNRNGIPDHTGLVASVSGNTVKTIEGNYRDAVGYRTFSVGYSMVQGYGLPNYDNANGIVYTGTSNTSVGCGELSALGIGGEPEGYEDLGAEYDFVEKKVEDNIGCGDEISDYEKMTYMVKKVRTNAETDGIDCSTTQYYAAFIYELCKEAGIESSIMTAEDADGNIHAWVETVLDGKWYKVDASKKSNQIVRFEHEATDIEG